jgi:hypothetical protein
MPRARVSRRCHRPSRWARDWRVGALVGLLILLVVGDLPVVHDHDEPGVYNEECPLGRLATCPPGASAPDPMPAPGLLPMFDALVPSVSVEAPAGSIAPSAPRAPPVLV